MVKNQVKVAGWLLNPLPFHLPLTRSMKSDEDLKSHQGLPSQDLQVDNSESSRTRGTFVHQPIRKHRWRKITSLPLAISALTVGLLVPKEGFTTKEGYIHTVLNEQRETVEVILDTRIFPHTAIRVGDRIYSPSQVTLNVFHLQQYVLPESPEHIRYFQTQELRLNPKEIEDLKNNFESLIWKKYHNYSGFYDCSTVVSDMLSKAAPDLKIPSIVNASPTYLMAWLKVQRLMGNNKIGPSRFIYNPASDDTTQQFISDSLQESLKYTVTAFEQSVESKLFFVLSPFIYYIQGEIRNQNDLFEANDEYRKLLSDLADEYYQDLLHEPTLKSHVRFFQYTKPLLEHKVSSYQHQTNSQDALNVGIQIDSTINRQSQLHKRKMREEIIRRRSDLNKLIAAEVDGSVRLSLEAKMRAIEMIKQDFRLGTDLVSR